MQSKGNGSVANSVLGDTSVFRNAVKIDFYDIELPDKQLFATEPVLQHLGSEDTG